MLALAICIGFGLAFVIANIRSWELEDAEAYWNAALRLRDGGELYPALANVNAPEVYRYAPWFAWLWVPLTYLPKEIVQVGWSVLLLAAGAVALLPILRVRSVAALCLVALLGGLLVRTASTGNVQSLLIAGLVYGAPRRSGPLWIGIAASLKFAPILFALTYVGRREWGRALIAALVATALLAPALLYDLGGYPADPGGNRYRCCRSPGLSPGWCWRSGVPSWQCDSRTVHTAGRRRLLPSLPQSLASTSTASRSCWSAWGCLAIDPHCGSGSHRTSRSPKPSLLSHAS